jgi:hypothetical protein
MVTFTDLLNQTLTMFDIDGSDPDGPTTRRGLLLAAHAGLTVDRCSTTAVHWDLYASAIGEALATLHADLPADYLLPTDVPDAGPDDLLLRTLVRALVGQLADRYAAAAADGCDASANGRPRRTVWAEVSNHLDDAAAQLP